MNIEQTVAACQQLGRQIKKLRRDVQDVIASDDSNERIEHLNALYGILDSLVDAKIAIIEALDGSSPEQL